MFNGTHIFVQVCILFSKTEKEGAVRQLLVTITEETVRQAQTLAPEVLQAYFQLLTAVVKKTPVLMTSSIDIQHVLSFGESHLLNE